MSLRNSTKILAAGAFGAAAAILFSLSAQAGPGATGLRCQGLTKEKVIKCCEQMIVNSSYRRIMGTSGRCEGAVVCARVKRGGDTYGLTVGGGSSKGAYRCWLRKIKQWDPNNDRSQDQPDGGKSNGNRGNQGNQGGQQGGAAGGHVP